MPKPSNLIFILILFFLGSAFLWMRFTLVDEVIRAEGYVEPEGKVQTIQPRFQSVVRDIAVAVGDKVRAGDILIRLNDKEAQAQFQENASSMAVLDSEIARLKAEVDMATRVEWPGSVTPSSQAAQENLFKIRRQHLLEQTLVLDEETRLIENKITESINMQNGLRRSLELKQQERIVYEPLVEAGAEPKLRLLSIDQEIQKIENDLSLMTTQLAEKRIELDRNTQRKREVITNYRAQALEAYAAKQNESDILNTKTNSLEERVAANELRSPVNGVVTKVMPSGPGTVISSGEPVVEIVPMSSKVMIKGSLDPRDVSSVKIGQQARILLGAYDYTTYGNLKATVSSVAQNTTKLETGEVYYQVWLQCDSIRFTKSDVIPDIVPGMLVQIEIVGRKKSILDYLLQPIQESKSRAFTEK